MRKPAFCICENKDAEQLRGNRKADQRLCFRYTDSTSCIKFAKYRKRIKYTHCIMDSKIKCKLELSDIKKKRTLNCIHLICCQDNVLFHLTLRTSRVLVGPSLALKKSNRKAMNRNWINQKANPALKTKTGNK